MMQDADRLPTSYEVWRISAEQVEGQVTRSGVVVVPILVEPDEFVARCNERGLRTTSARSAATLTASTACALPSRWLALRSEGRMNKEIRAEPGTLRG
ncbi:hypothetical protein M446_3969 [Methylobacterium sp. 4-46]|nr:hypothetical protein M446_3969 [Methylobacterium sp. 4-46]